MRLSPGPGLWNWLWWFSFLIFEDEKAELERILFYPLSGWHFEPGIIPYCGSCHGHYRIPSSLPGLSTHYLWQSKMSPNIARCPLGGGEIVNCWKLLIIKYCHTNSSHTGMISYLLSWLSVWCFRPPEMTVCSWNLHEPAGRMPVITQWLLRQSVVILPFWDHDNKDGSNSKAATCTYLVWARPNGAYLNVFYGKRPIKLPMSDSGCPCRFNNPNEHFIWFLMRRKSPIPKESVVSHPDLRNKAI